MGKKYFPHLDCITTVIVVPILKSLFIYSYIISSWTHFNIYCHQKNEILKYFIMTNKQTNNNKGRVGRNEEEEEEEEEEKDNAPQLQ